MKYPCNMIKDILPLYVDEVCSKESRQAVEEHLSECSECGEYYNKIKLSEVVEDLAYDEKQDVETAKSIKQVKKKIKLKTVLTVILTVLGAGLVFIIYKLGLVALACLLIIFSSGEPEIHTDVSEYSRYMCGENADENYRVKWEMDESIFPSEITPEMNVKDYKMIYYDPWDAQYLGYLTVSYSDLDYQKETARLRAYNSTDYLGYYGVTGFDPKYTLLAMYADSYQGFVYALTDGKNEIVYVEMIFCNYFMDLDYNEYVPKEYLPVGFDAGSENAYRKKMLSE